MKKAVIWMTLLACILILAGCSGKSKIADIPDLSEIRVLVAEQGDTEGDCLETLSGQPRDALVQAWGEPDGMLSGFWGDIWELGDEDDQIIIIYYDRDGFVSEIRIREKSN